MSSAEGQHAWAASKTSNDAQPQTSDQQPEVKRGMPKASIDHSPRALTKSLMLLDHARVE